MPTLFRHGPWGLLFLILLAGCGGRELAPVRIAHGPPLAWGLESAGPIRRSPSGIYKVRPGDTLWAIATVHEVDVEDLALWNHIKDQDQLFVGQKLRVRPVAGVAERKGAEPPMVGAALLPPPGTRLVEEADLPPARGSVPAPVALPAPVHPVPAAPTVPSRPPVPAAPLAPPAVVAAPPVKPAPPVAAPPLPPAVEEEEETPAAPAPASTPPPKNTWVLKAEAPKTWTWPLQGKVIRRFGTVGGQKSTGIDIAAREGTPVAAAAEGVVVYADDGLPGYGKMIILRHGGSYMTAYAHNQAILVRQGERVSAGQVIAKAGQTGRVSSPRLHFELRKGVKPVDPIGYLPKV